MITIEGMLDSRPIYHDVSKFSDSGNKYLISRFTVQNAEDPYSPEVTVKGEMNSPVYGWRYRLHGQWEESDRGTAFKFSSFEAILPTNNSGLIDYLSRYVPALGTHRARLIVDKFGDESLNILRYEPRRIDEIEGIGTKTAAAVAEFFEGEQDAAVDPAAYSRLYDLLSSVRPPRRVILSLLKRFGSNAEQFVREDPYRLIAYPGMGWDRVDLLARETLKYRRDGLSRHKAAIREAIDRRTAHGDTKVDADELRCDASELLGMKVRPDAMELLIVNGELVADGPWVIAWNLDEAERGIVRHIRRLQDTFEAFVRLTPLAGLDDKQADIVPMFKDNAVCILTGTPGSGKSFSTSLIMKSIVSFGIEDIIVCAPTGKAAKREQELLSYALPGINIPCMTIHRALGCRPSDEETDVPGEDAKVGRGRDGYEFVHDEDCPLPYRIFVCAEASMADVYLFYCLVRAIPDGSRLFIVGDENQLPSVGPGAVLRDLVRAVPTVTLDKPRRNSGSIALACYQINQGQRINPALLSEQARREGFPDNLTHREVPTEEGVLQFIQELHINYIKKYGVDMLKQNVQVISPEKKGIVGCHSLNAAIRQIATPPGDEFKLGSDEKGGIRIGDKVVRTKNGMEEILLRPDVSFDDLTTIFGRDEAREMDLNDWREDADRVWIKDEEYLIHKCYLVNGDIGEAIGIHGKRLIVRFMEPDRTCFLKPGESHVILAYAMTVHKMMGSQAPIIVLPLADFYWNPKTRSGIWMRELVYPAMSRPTERMITVGPLSCLHDAIGRQTVDRRKTRLRELMEAST